MSELAAVVLAAGSSSRMGSNKLRLPWQQSTVLETVLDLVDELPFSQRLIVLGHQADSWQQVLAARSGWQQVLNAAYRTGAASSVVAAAAQVEPRMQGICFFLGDQPLLERETVWQIIAAWQKQGGIIVPTYRGKRGNPVLFDSTYRAEMLTLAGDAGARQIFSRHAACLHELNVEDSGVCLDLDTPQQYARLKGE